jgi:hypothetical protein
MLEQIPGDYSATGGADKAYDTAGFVVECGKIQVTPHVAQNIILRSGGSAIDARTTRHGGCAINQKKRKRVEESFGWLKTIALMRKVRHTGEFTRSGGYSPSAAAYNLVRMRNLLSPGVQSA